MPLELERISNLFKSTYAGEAWHAKSTREILDGVTAAHATQRPAPGTHNHNLAELVAHVTAWRVFALEKLTGGESYDIILNSEQDWPVIESLTDEGWAELLEDFDDTQNELLDVLATLPRQRLGDPVPGRRYDYYTLLHGVIQHDIYHAGQMAYVRKLIEGLEG
jgi:uncharacterized damage-inducible protein DinB